MKIGIIGSMHFSEKMLEVAEGLRALGHEPILSNFVQSFPGKDDAEKEKIKLEQKFEEERATELPNGQLGCPFFWKP